MNDIRMFRISECEYCQRLIFAHASSPLVGEREAIARLSQQDRLDFHAAGPLPQVLVRLYGCHRFRQQEPELEYLEWCVLSLSFWCSVLVMTAGSTLHGAFRTFTSVCVYFYSIGTIIPGIPVYSILIRYAIASVSLFFDSSLGTI